MNELITQPHIEKLTDMKGGKLVVDAPDTARASAELQEIAVVGGVIGMMVGDEDVTHIGDRNARHGDLTTCASAAINQIGRIVHDDEIGAG